MKNTFIMVFGLAVVLAFAACENPATDNDVGGGNDPALNGYWLQYLSGGGSLAGRLSAFDFDDGNFESVFCEILNWEDCSLTFIPVLAKGTCSVNADGTLSMTRTHLFGSNLNQYTNEKNFEARWYSRDEIERVDSQYKHVAMSLLDIAETYSYVIGKVESPSPSIEEYTLTLTRGSQTTTFKSNIRPLNAPVSF